MKDNLNYEKLITIACLTGFIGDFGIQLITKKMGGPTGWGFKPYFLQHGSVESACIAAGMVTLFYIVYLYVFRLPPVWYYMAIYAILLDLLFREMMIFPSLQEYYKQVNYFGTAFFGGVIPLLIPLIVMKLISFIQ